MCLNMSSAKWPQFFMYIYTFIERDDCILYWNSKNSEIYELLKVVKRPLEFKAGSWNDVVLNKGNVRFQSSSVRTYAKSGPLFPRYWHLWILSRRTFTKCRAYPLLYDTVLFPPMLVCRCSPPWIRWIRLSWFYKSRFGHGKCCIYKHTKSGNEFRFLSNHIGLYIPKYFGSLILQHFGNASNYEIFQALVYISTCVFMKCSMRSCVSNRNDGMYFIFHQRKCINDMDNVKIHFGWYFRPVAPFTNMN